MNIYNHLENCPCCSVVFRLVNKFVDLSLVCMSYIVDLEGTERKRNPLPCVSTRIDVFSRSWLQLKLYCLNLGNDSYVCIGYLS